MKRRLAWASIALAMLAAFGPGRSAAQAAPDSPPTGASTATTSTVAAPPSTAPSARDELVPGDPLPRDAEGEFVRAERPDVDRRPPAKPSVGESLLWVPRVVFFPVYVVTEFVIRRPVGWVMTIAERDQWPALFIDLFTFGPERKVGVVPTAFIDFNFRPSIGVYVFANDAWVEGHDIRAQFGFGGLSWWLVALSDRWALSDDLRLDLGFRFSLRPDNVFHGLGPSSLFDDRSRYQSQNVRGSVGLRQNLFGLGELWLESSIEEVSFNLTDTAFSDDDPSLAEAIALGFYEAPPGTDGYFVIRGRADAAIDSRRDIRKNGTGVGVRVVGTYSADIDSRQRREWFILGGGAAGHLDLGHNRILSLGGYAANVFQTGSDPVPFTELPTSGNAALILGAFLPGRLTGSSIVGAAAEYRYDIWALIDGRAFFSVGNVFGPDFDEFSADLLRMSYGLGFASVGDPDASFNFLLAFGHETFEQGSGLDSVRLLVGFQPDL